MIDEIGNHLWQSTAFVAVAALVAFTLRNNGAHVRHVVWMVASLKFLVPFSLLMSLGGAVPIGMPTASTESAAPGVVAMARDLSVTVDRFAQPFAADALDAASPVAAAQSQLPLDWVMAAVWAAGFLTVVAMRVRDWRRVRAAVRASVPLPPAGPFPVRSAPGLLEPGVVGLWRQVLLLPTGIEQHLSPAQLRAVLEHEFAHIRRRDNLTSALHMVVEAVCWFHPAVWWVGARLVEERERACDEHVLRVCGEPEVYAEGILNVCKLYVESPLACVSGVSGADLKTRVSAILAGRVGRHLTGPHRAALVAIAGVAVCTPLLAGMVELPQRAADSGVRFEAFTLKPCDPATAKPAQGAARPGFRSIAAPYAAMVTPGHAFWSCATLSQLIPVAYMSTAQPLLNTSTFFRTQDANQPSYVTGGPSWVRSDGFSIEAKVPLALTAELLGENPSRDLRLPPSPGWSDALRAVLEDRFQLKVSRVPEQRDMYALTIAPGGLKPDRISVAPPGDCLTNDQYSAAAAAAPPRTPPTTAPRTVAEMMANVKNPRLCGRAFSGFDDKGSYLEYTSVTFTELARLLSGQLDYVVIDRTGTTDVYNFRLAGPAVEGETRDQRSARQLAELGLKLELVKGPAEYLRIDSVERLRTDGAAGR